MHTERCLSGGATTEMVTGATRTFVANSDDVPVSEFVGLNFVCVRSRCGLVVCQQEQGSNLSFDIFHQQHLARQLPICTDANVLSALS